MYSTFSHSRCLQVVLDEKSLQKYTVNYEVLDSSILGSTLFYYTLITFLMMLSAILESILMILLSILSVISHPICGNNYSWLLNLNRIYKTLWTGVGSGLLIPMLEQLSLFDLTGLITMTL